MNSFRLTEQAETDLVEIFLYGLEQFATGQASRYKDELAVCFQLLAENPPMGRSADAIAPGVRRHEHGSHVILYEIDEAGILVLAVVHGRSVRRLEL